jgi:acyl-coenzyme A thioesterase PaaI-like protein
VATEVAALCDIVTHADLADDELEALHDQLLAARAAMDRSAGPHDDSGARPGRGKWWDDPTSPARAYRDRGPFTGAENPRAPGLVIDELPAGVDRLTIEGRVTLGKSFAGPPGAVHGGVLAGLFDEMVGHVAQLATPDAIAVTATLMTRFRRPTPLATPLLFTATVEPRSARRFRAVATCSANGVMTAEAVALLVGRP